MTEVETKSECSRVLVYSFEQAKKKGFGARLYDICNALMYTKYSNATLKFIRDQEIPFTLQRWSMIFKSSAFDEIELNDVITKKYPVWYNCPWEGGFFTRGTYTLADYSKGLQQIYQITPEAQLNIDSRVKNSGFQTSDIVIHLRLSDKVKQVADGSTNQESAEHDKRWYWSEVLQYLKRVKKRIKEQQEQHNESSIKSSVGSSSSTVSILPALPTRIFLCSDSPNALEMLQTSRHEFIKHLQEVDLLNQAAEKKRATLASATISNPVVLSISIPVQENIQCILDLELIWDEKEVRMDGFCPKAWTGKLTQEQMEEETWNSMKNFEIMRQCVFLIGARASYFFRIGELLRYPLLSVNVKDSDTFGAAEYTLEPAVRECQLNAVVPFINTQSKRDMDKYRLEMKVYNRTTITNFMIPKVAEELGTLLQHLNYNGKLVDLDSWYVRALKHQDTKKSLNLARDCPHKKKSQEQWQKEMDKHISKAQQSHDKGMFSYFFKRTEKHSSNCPCATCKLQATFISFEVLDFISSIVGEEVVRIHETFSSIYERGHYLDVHADKQKGSYAFVLSFTKNWNVAHGGLLHFVDGHGTPEQKITATVIPTFNSLNIFRIPTDGSRMDHFVSTCTGPYKRISFTGWFSTEDFKMEDD
ncbi:MAG: hypothetical protein Sylvanvirus8_23 [Sylvanvirus sp.]|uniref:Prolyl 3,4-dihydroxylase TPA1/OFD1 N-terminal domain-containing protein n=1 Tax=Sylvanvirus sp. TaxID=2487774 RepID=A0A3G5AHU0_9VIRU|nr:MAG: hypothetical protein Sylvanvirus8_23 [Sylvanvirus sp.]